MDVQVQVLFWALTFLSSFLGLGLGLSFLFFHFSLLLLEADTVLIKNLDELIESENTETKLVKINDELWITLANVGYSSSRGILLAKNQGTAFEDLILPVYDISKLSVSTF